MAASVRVLLSLVLPELTVDLSRGKPTYQSRLTRRKSSSEITSGKSLTYALHFALNSARLINVCTCDLVV